MRLQDKTMLTTVFQALGPERVERGLAAVGHTWRDCFLALALHDGPGMFARDLQKRWRKEYYVGTLIGVSVQMVQAVVRAWDQDETAFRALAAEWLELNRTVETPARAVGIAVS